MRPTAPKDLAIWRGPWSTCWDDKENALLAPLALIDWKVSRGRKGGRETTHETAWLRGFARVNPKSVGYSIAARFRDGDEHCSVSVARFVCGKRIPRWFEG